MVLRPVKLVSFNLIFRNKKIGFRFKLIISLLFGFGYINCFEDKTKLIPFVGVDSEMAFRTVSIENKKSKPYPFSKKFNHSSVRSFP